MVGVNVAIVYYSATGSVYALAQEAAAAAAKAGAEVRLRKVHELAPREAIASNEGWSKHAVETENSRRRHWTTSNGPTSSCSARPPATGCRPRSSRSSSTPPARCGARAS